MASARSRARARGALLRPAQDGAVGERRAGQVERLRKPLVDDERALEGGDRGHEVALGRQDQSFAAAGTSLAPGALDPAEAVLQLGQEPARLLELGQLDERLDRVRQLTEDARLAPPRRREPCCKRPQDRVGGRCVADGKLEKAEHAEVLEPERLVSAALRERDPPLRGVRALSTRPRCASTSALA